MAGNHWRVGILVGVVLAAGCASAPPAPSSAPSAWADWKLPGKRPTAYRMDHEDGRAVVRAEATASASMFRRVVALEPGRLHRVRFSWRVDQLVEGANLRDRDMEDAPVRIVLAFGGDHSTLPAKERALFEFASLLTGETPPYATLMYVWDNHAPLETVIPGNRSDRIRKIVVERGTDHVGAWRLHERDVVADFRRAFGEEPGPLVGVALMTDADNTGARARAVYGEVELLDRAGLRL